MKSPQLSRNIAHITKQIEKENSLTVSEKQNVKVELNVHEWQESKAKQRKSQAVVFMIVLIQIGNIWCR